VTYGVAVRYAASATTGRLKMQDLDNAGPNNVTSYLFKTCWVRINSLHKQINDNDDELCMCVLIRSEHLN